MVHQRQRQTCFKNVRIKNAYISKESVKLLLKQHQINELLINNIQINSNDCVDDPGGAFGSLRGVKSLFVTEIVIVICSSALTNG